MWLSCSGRPPLCMHCLSEDHLAAHCPHTGDNLLSSLAPQWARPLPALTSQWAMSPYRPGVQPSNHKDPPCSFLPMWQTHQVAQDLHTTNGSQLHVGSTMVQRGQGETTTNLPTAAAHVGDFILPLCATCLSIQRELTSLLGPGSIPSSQR